MPKKPDPFRRAVGERLITLRLAKGFETIRSFAKELDVEEDRYTAWEKGKALIPPQEVLAIRTRFGVTADWIYFGDAAGISRALYGELKPLRSARI